MMGGPACWRELDALIDRHCEGMLTCEEAARLEVLLRGDREALRRFLACLYLDGAMRWERAVGTAAPFSLGLDEDLPRGPWGPGEDDFVAQAANCREDEYPILDAPTHALPVAPPNLEYAPVALDSLSDTRREVSLEWFLPWLATVAVFGALVFGISRWDCPPASLPVAVHEGLPLPAAWVTLLHEVQWADEQMTYGWGSPVGAGSTLRLKSGLVRLVFSSGAEVVLEGPVTFTPDSAVAGQLNRGKLVARAETDQAQGFTIRTPTAQIVDLGTEFGVVVDEQGRTETHVFVGRVLAQAIGVKRTTSEPLRLDAGQAARAESRRGGLRRMAAAPEAFIRHTPPRKLSPVLHYALEEPKGLLVDRRGNAKATPNGDRGFLYHQPGVPSGTYGAIRVGPDGTGFCAGLNDATTQWNLDAAGTTRLNRSNNFTVMTWLYLPAAPMGIVKVVGQDIANPARGWAFGVREAGEGRGVFFSACGISDFYSGTAISWAGGQWHHIAVTKSSVEGIRFYLDGKLVGMDNSRTAHGDLHRLASNEFYCLGRGNDYIEEPGDGRRIDEFCVYDAVLTPEEIVLAASKGHEAAQ